MIEAGCQCECDTVRRRFAGTPDAFDDLPRDGRGLRDLGP